jgi:hypothetical protein
MVTKTPTPDPIEQTFSQLKSEGISVDAASGELSFGGVKVPATSIDLNTGDLHIQMGEQQITLTKDEIAQRLASKEGSLVVYDERGSDSYKNADMSTWTQVDWAFSPSATTERWSGWNERSEVISPNTVNEFGRVVVDRKKPVIAGNTYAEGADFLRIQLAFLQPFSEDTVLPNPVDKDYQDRTEPDASFPFPRIDDMSKYGIRPAVNFWKLLANPEEGRARDVGGIVQQVVNPNNKSDIQALNFPSIDNNLSIDEYFRRYSAFGTYFPGYLMPLYRIGGPGWKNGNFKTFRQYYVDEVSGFVDDSSRTTDNPLGEVNGKIYSLVREWLDSGVMPEELQQIWLVWQEFQIGNEF